jgi:hypothetical protein
MTVCQLHMLHNVNSRNIMNRKYVEGGSRNPFELFSGHFHAWIEEKQVTSVKISGIRKEINVSHLTALLSEPM